MVKEDEAFTQVRDLIVRETAISPAKVTASARLVEDLGIYGDDLVDLMEAFFDQTGVEVGAYTHTDYASEEGFRLFGKAKPTRPLPVSTLIESLREGKWTAP